VVHVVARTISNVLCDGRSVAEGGKLLLCLGVNADAVGQVVLLCPSGCSRRPGTSLFDAENVTASHFAHALDQRNQNRIVLTIRVEVRSINDAHTHHIAGLIRHMNGHSRGTVAFVKCSRQLFNRNNGVGGEFAVWHCITKNCNMRSCARSIITDVKHQRPLSLHVTLATHADNRMANDGLKKGRFSAGRTNKNEMGDLHNETSFTAKVA